MVRDVADLLRHFSAATPQSLESCWLCVTPASCVQEIFKVGAMFAVINLTIWGGVGAFWWKVIGLY